MSVEQFEDDRTTVEIKRSTHERLVDLKPYDSMSFDELISEMAGVYAATRRAP